MGLFSKFTKKGASEDAPAKETTTTTTASVATEQPSAPQAAASADEIEYVQSTWQLIFPISGPNKLSAEELNAKKTAVGVLLFREIFSLAPEALQLFSF